MACISRPSAHAPIVGALNRARVIRAVCASGNARHVLSHGRRSQPNTCQSHGERTAIERAIVWPGHTAGACARPTIQWIYLAWGWRYRGKARVQWPVEQWWLKLSQHREAGQQQQQQDHGIIQNAREGCAISAMPFVLMAGGCAMQQIAMKLTKLLRGTPMTTEEVAVDDTSNRRIHGHKPEQGNRHQALPITKIMHQKSMNLLHSRL